MSAFKITYSWQQRSKPLPFAEEDYVDASVLFLALERFLAIHQGEFIVQVDNLRLHFDLDPDLSTVFEEIPAVLEDLTADTESPVELYFYEQGTDLALLIGRQKDAITLRFRKGPYTGKRFADLPETLFSAPAEVFMEEWIRFVRAILDAMTVLQPNLAQDESYREYRTRLLALESRRNYSGSRLDSARG